MRSRPKVGAGALDEPARVPVDVQANSALIRQLIHSIRLSPDFPT
jgi:hypothetical protein